MATEEETISFIKFDKVEDWQKKFNELSKAQLTALREDDDTKKVMSEHNMNVIYRTWSDIGRSFGSSVGSNITDMQFFGIAPKEVRPTSKPYKDLDKEYFVAFPAIRVPNYSDEVDIRTANKIKLRVKNRSGVASDTTLDEFLKHIGEYICDLPSDADWSDKADSGPMQAACQFSILPAPTGRADVGIAAYGYQSKNLHIVIGPSGDIGWAPEARGFKRIYFRNQSDDSLRSIALVPEDREEVREAFFKEPAKDESLRQESKRYEKVENRIYHIQIEMETPPGYNPTRVASPMMPPPMPMPMMCAMAGSAPPPPPPGAAPPSVKYKSSSKMRRSRGAPPPPSAAKAMQKGLNLARVVAGDSLGSPEKSDRVPVERGTYAKRARGVAVRVTEMYYAVAADGKVTADRVDRFMKQMSFARRAKGLEHGSLVTGQGTWSESGNTAPIKLKGAP